MADESADTPQFDFAEHERTFAGFVALTKFVILAIVTTLVSILIITFTESGFFRFVGFVLLFSAFVVGFAEFRLKSSGMVALSLLVLTFLVLIVAVA